MRAAHTPDERTDEATFSILEDREEEVGREAAPVACGMTVVKRASGRGGRGGESRGVCWGAELPALRVDGGSMFASVAGSSSR